MRTRTVIVLGLSLVLFRAPGLIAAEPEELREKAQKAKQEAMELKKLGRAEESEQAARRAKELLEVAERLQGKQSGVAEEKMERLRGHLKDLIDKQRRLDESGASAESLAEIRERIDQTKRELETLEVARKNQLGPKDRPPLERDSWDKLAGRLEDAGRRIKHVRIAAEHLHQAGIHDLADQLMEKADAMEREAGEAKRHMPEEQERQAGPEHRGEIGLAAQMNELRQEVRRLREEMNELRQHAKKLEQSRNQGK